MGAHLRARASLTSTMRAIQMNEFGGPEVLHLVELPDPQPRPEEVLIRVTRAGVNFADTHTRTNSYVQRATLPLVPGGEVAGTRADTGERVVALVGTGGYAEYATAPRELTYPIPDGLDDGAALAMIVQVSTGSLLRHSRSVVGFYLFHCLQRPGMFTGALSDLFARAGRGELEVVVGRTYPLAQAAQAHVDLRARATTGKLLLDPAA